MSEVEERYAAVAGGFGRRVAGVGGDQWSAPTPCADWSVRELVAHVVGVHRRVIATVDQTEPLAVHRAGDLEAQWREASAAIVAVLGDDRATKTVSGMFGEQPFESLVGRLVCADTLVHTWDLARATGQDELLDPLAVSRARQFLAPIDEPMRRPGGFAPKIEPAPDASEQTDLLNFCGRAV